MIGLLSGIVLLLIVLITILTVKLSKAAMETDNQLNSDVTNIRLQNPLLEETESSMRLREVLRNNPDWSVDDVFLRVPNAIAIFSAEHVRHLISQEGGKLQQTIPQEDDTRYHSGSFLRKQGAQYPYVPEKWQKGQLLGCGSFGEVWKGIRLDGTFFAVKIIALRHDMISTEVTKLVSEVKTMSDLQHPHVVEYYGCTFDADSFKLNIFMEYLEGGSLGALVRLLQEPLCLPTAKNYISQILNGVSFLHSKKIIHRDLKGDNILISAEGVKLCDFGTCKKLKNLTGPDEQQSGESIAAKTLVGTPLWMAPEVICSLDDESDGYGTSADIWSVGCVAVEVLNRGVPPWHPFVNNWSAILTIGQWKKPLPPNIPSGLPDACMDFLRKCFCPRPAERHNANQLMRHEFVNDCEVRKKEPRLLIEIEDSSEGISKNTTVPPLLSTITSTRSSVVRRRHNLSITLDRSSLTPLSTDSPLTTLTPTRVSSSTFLPLFSIQSSPLSLTPESSASPLGPNVRRPFTDLPPLCPLSSSSNLRKDTSVSSL